MPQTATYFSGDVVLFSGRVGPAFKMLVEK